MDNWHWINNICQAALLDFERVLTQPEKQQTNLLKTIVSNNRDSLFGRQHHFNSIDNYESYVQHVAISNYDDLQSAITELANGNPQQLTSEVIIQFEETGGSTSGAKLIPYTHSVLTAFQRAILPWLGDLLQHRPAICKGRVFFMISPALRPPTSTQGGIPIGAGDDLGYFGEDLAHHLAQVTLYSPLLAEPQTSESWKKQAALLLLQASDLTLISLWSPTLLIELIDYIITYKSLLLKEINNKECLERLNSAIDTNHIDTQSIWTLLDTISCWDSHTSAIHAKKLQQLFPHAIIQGKGLLSTESVTSLPYSKASHPILAINSHFYEFIDDKNHLFLAHQLQQGKTYRVVVTTQAGLYRYDTGDCVKVTGHYKNTPTLAFVGRMGLSSDLCGEKLTESFVSKAITQVSKALIGNSILVAVNNKNNPKPYYRWVIQNSPNLTDTAILIQQLEQALCKNPQYQYARDMGQLGELCIKKVTDINRYYQQQNQQKNRRIGMIKLPSLLPTD